MDALLMAHLQTEATLVSSATWQLTSQAHPILKANAYVKLATPLSTVLALRSVEMGWWSPFLAVPVMMETQRMVTDAHLCATLRSSTDAKMEAIPLPLFVSTEVYHSTSPSTRQYESKERILDSSIFCLILPCWTCEGWISQSMSPLTATRITKWSLWITTMDNFQ